MNIIVTGGAGFIGSHLCEMLLKQKTGKDKNNVICVDNMLTGSVENIKHLLYYPNFRVCEQDINFFDAGHVVDKIDRIFHLASPASPIKYKQYALATMYANIYGTEKMLRLAKKYNARFLFASTSEVYGDPLMHPQDETDYGNVNCFGERSCYDESKRVGETLCYEYQKLGVDVRIARIFNTYGPRMDINDGRVVSSFIVNTLQNKPLIIYGDGKQTRSFCYIDDLVDGLKRLMISEYNKPINLGNNTEVDINYIAKVIQSLCETNIEIIYEPRTQDDPTCRQPVLDKAQANLNWYPQIPLHEGLFNTINYFKKILGINNE